MAKGIRVFNEVTEQEISVAIQNDNVLIKVDGQLVTVMSKNQYVTLLGQMHRLINGE